MCLRCRTHCCRCDVELNDENFIADTKKRNRYICRACNIERVKKSKVDSKYSQRDYNLLRNYGITATEYEKMFDSQGGVCYICGASPKNNRLHVDHKHEKGERKQNPRGKRNRVRGLLCWQCNSAMGKFKDDPVRLRKAAEYLENPPAKKIIKEA